MKNLHENSQRKCLIKIYVRSKYYVKIIYENDQLKFVMKTVNEKSQLNLMKWFLKMIDENVKLKKLLKTDSIDTLKMIILN